MSQRDEQSTPLDVCSVFESTIDSLVMRHTTTHFSVTLRQRGYCADMKERTSQRMGGSFWTDQDIDVQVIQAGDELHPRHL